MKNLVLLTSLLISCSLSAQSIVRSNINAIGAVQRSGSLVLSQSIGQPSNTAVFENHEYLRQGFQQASAQHFRSDNIQITLFPNPNNGNFSFMIEGNKEALSYSIIDVQGRSIRSKNKINDTTNAQVRLNNLAAGIYLLVLYSDKKILTQEKFIVY